MKQKIYKIITIVMMISVIFSVTCINASAFGYTHGDEIPESGYNYGGVRCYDNYAIVNLGLVDDLRYVSYDLETIFNFDNYDQLSQLNQFLYDVNNQNPDLIPHFYNYDTYVSFLEFYLIDIHTGDIIPFSHPLAVGVGDCHFFLEGFYVFEENPDNIFLYTVLEEFVENYSGYALQCVCYFNVVDPLFHYSEFLEDKESLISEVDDLGRRLSDLNDVYDRLYENYNKVQADYDKALEENNKLDRLIFEMKNANVIDEVFTGTSESIITIIQSISGLGYSPIPGSDFKITVGNLITVIILASFVTFIARLFFGGGNKS